MAPPQVAFADVAGERHPPPGQSVDQAGLARPRCTQQRNGDPRRQQRPQLVEAAAGEVGHSDDVDPGRGHRCRRPGGGQLGGVDLVGLGQHHRRPGSALPGDHQLAHQPGGVDPGVEGLQYQQVVEVGGHRLGAQSEIVAICPGRPTLEHAATRQAHLDAGGVGVEAAPVADHRVPGLLVGDDQLPSEGHPGTVDAEPALVDAGDAGGYQVVGCRRRPGRFPSVIPAELALLHPSSLAGRHCVVRRWRPSPRADTGTSTGTLGW